MRDRIQDYDVVAYLTVDGHYELRQYVGGEPVLLVNRICDPVRVEAEALDLAYQDGSDAWIQEAQGIFRCLTVPAPRSLCNDGDAPRTDN